VSDAVAENGAWGRFADAYARHRAAEGRAYGEDDLLALPYLRAGPLARQWAVKARTFEAFEARVLRPLARRRRRPLTLLDLGAGNGWLSYRTALRGHSAIAIDIRGDDVDGLGAARPYIDRTAGRIETRIATFEALPAESASVDLAVFNASIHYALDLRAVLDEARRTVRPGGMIAILDSPFYRREADGITMVAAKQADAASRFGSEVDILTAFPFIEFLTRERLAIASRSLGLAWRRHRVRYPLWYELRPLQAALARRRCPSRFDLWFSTVP
jgi:SAM-dependent methyltransferase